MTSKTSNLNIEVIDIPAMAKLEALILEKKELTRSYETTKENLDSDLYYLHLDCKKHGVDRSFGSLNNSETARAIYKKHQLTFLEIVYKESVSLLDKKIEAQLIEVRSSLDNAFIKKEGA